MAAVRQPVYRACLAVMYGCGLRIGEAYQLKPSQIDKTRMVIRVIGKGNKERLVPLPPSLLEGLRRAWLTHRNPAWVFANRPDGHPLSLRMIYFVFKSAREEAKVPQATPHVLRQPEVLALSALLTTTMPEMRKIIQQLTLAGLRDQVKIIVGGAPVNQRFATDIGADGYAPNAGEAVDAVRRLLQLG